MRKGGTYEFSIYFSSSSATSERYTVQRFRYDGNNTSLYNELIFSCNFLNYLICFLQVLLPPYRKKYSDYTL